MGEIFVTSDLHLNHVNILKYEPKSRPFQSVAEMNSKIIKNYNDMVKEGDTVFILGDFILGDTSETEKIISQFKTGSIKLVPGNHDTDKKLEICAKNGIEILPQLIDFKRGKRGFVFCHYPMQTWRHEARGAIHCFGHVHNLEKSHRVSAIKYPYNAIHIGIDEHDLKPWTLDEIIENCNSRKEI